MTEGSTWRGGRGRRRGGKEGRGERGRKERAKSKPRCQAQSTLSHHKETDSQSLSIMATLATDFLPSVICGGLEEMFASSRRTTNVSMSSTILSSLMNTPNVKLVSLERMTVGRTTTASGNNPKSLPPTGRKRRLPSRFLH